MLFSFRIWANQIIETFCENSQNSNCSKHIPLKIVCVSNSANPKGYMWISVPFCLGTWKHLFYALLMCIKHCGKPGKFKRNRIYSANENMLTHLHTFLYIVIVTQWVLNIINCLTSKGCLILNAAIQNPFFKKNTCVYTWWNFKGCERFHYVIKKCQEGIWNEWRGMWSCTGSPREVQMFKKVLKGKKRPLNLRRNV